MVISMKMICLECGHSFDNLNSKECPICKNEKDEMLLKSIEINNYQMHKIGICHDEEIKKEVKR